MRNIQPYRSSNLQRVAIARSLAANPNILLMDEPFGALDVKNRLQMQDLLIDIWDKYHSTIIFVTHDLDEAVYLGDDIYIMKYTPSNIGKHIYVDLPFNRSRQTKREKRFNELVLELGRCYVGCGKNEIIYTSRE